MNKIIKIVFLLFTIINTNVFADIPQDIHRRIVSKLNTIMPQSDIEDIQALENIPNLYLVQLNKGDIVFIDAKTENFFIGDLINIKDKPFSINAKYKQKFNAERLLTIKTKDFIVFPAKDKKKSTITVFTDTSCTYCKKLHKELNKINEAGIEVRFLPFPRNGFNINNKETQNLINIWCSSDRKESLELAIEDKFNESNNNNCSENKNLEDIYMLGKELNITGTPTIFLENGEKISGFLPATKLIQRVFEN